MLYGKCLYGLGNRLTVICATYACARVRGIASSYHWTNDWDCQCKYGDLFEPHPLIAQATEIPSEGETFSACVYYPDWMPQHLHGARLTELTEDYWEAWRECARGFRLRPDLTIPHRQNFVAVHAREHDHLRAEGTKVKLNDLPAFLACDSPALKARLQEMMPSSWCIETQIAENDYGDGCRTLPQMQDAARDLMMLTRASAILTIGRDSTFRNLAVMGFQVPCFKYHCGWVP